MDRPITDEMIILAYRTELSQNLQEPLFEALIADMEGDPAAMQIAKLQDLLR